MPVIAAVPDSLEGLAAIHAGVEEARRLDTCLLLVNLGLRPLDTTGLPEDVRVQVLDRSGREDRDPADAVLDEVESHDAVRLVIGVRRRSRVGKALLGSVSQRLLLESPVPVLAVKTSAG